MSSSEQEPSVHLISLMEAAPDPRQQDRILTLAADGEVRLYIQKSPGLDVYAGSKKHHLFHGITRLMQEQGNEIQPGSSPTTANPALSSEIQFLALVPVHAQGLLHGRLVMVTWFDGGLKLTRSDAMHPHGRLEYVAAQFWMGHEGAILNDDGTPWFGQMVNRRDVLLDRRVLGLAVDPSTNSPSTVAASTIDTRISYQLENVFQLQSRAPGVFLLYAAAEHFYNSGHTDSVNQDKVKKWLKNDGNNPAATWASGRFNNYEKLATEANRRLAYKLIDTGYDLDKIGRKKRPGKPLDAKAVQSALEYRTGGYVSDRLALVALAVKHWEELTEANPAKEGDVAAKATHQLDLIDKLRREVRKWGIDSGSELDSIIDFVTWPELAADYRKAKKK